MNITKILNTVAVACIAVATSPAWAAMSPAEVDRLGKDLTPNGAERAGNKDGTIPEWQGGMTKPPAGWKPEMGYTDPFNADKPLYVITAKNFEQYKDKLTAGQIALLKKYPNFTMPVYQTRRTFSYPQEVYEATKAQAAKATMSDSNTLKNFALPGTPFPVPKSGAEAIMNHQTRWSGSYQRCSDWLPVRADGQYYRVGLCEDLVQAQNFDKRQPNHLFSFYGWYDAPSTLLGTIYLVHDPLDFSEGKRQAWIYNGGQRRVRRAPDLAYDASQDGDEGMAMSDDYWAYNGPLDRYDWKLVGKKEVLIPYNAYKLTDPKLKYKDMVEKGTLKSDLFRYETHRVWHVQATLKSGVTHVYAKRDFYLDEDSHVIAWADAYDGRGNLWRAYSCPLFQAYDAQTMLHAMCVGHDVINGNYLVRSAFNERKAPSIVWGKKGNWADFQLDAFRRRASQ